MPTGEWSAAEYYRGRLMTEEEIEHMLSMVFPDVRLKNYIEIRMADSLPKEEAFAYTALIRDIFYGGNISKIRRYLGNPTEEEIAQLAKTQGKTVEQIKNIIASLHEFNPMMGHRGCRLAVTFPEIAAMQTRAVIKAALLSLIHI